MHAATRAYTGSGVRLNLFGMELFDAMMEGLVRAGREAARVRFIGEVQARLLALRLARRSKRDDVVDHVLDMYRRQAITDPTLTALCRELDTVDQEIERLDAALGRARGNQPTRPSTPVVTEVTSQHRPRE